MTKSVGRKALPIVLAPILIIGVAFFWLTSRPKYVLARVLASNIPVSATSVFCEKKTIQDSRVVKLWAVMNLSLQETEGFISALDMKLDREIHGIVLPDPEGRVDWWDPPNGMANERLSSKWLARGDPYYSPSFCVFLWHQNKLSIYYMGIPLKQSKVAEQGVAPNDR